MNLIRSEFLILIHLFILFSLIRKISSNSTSNLNAVEDYSIELKELNPSEPTKNINQTYNYKLTKQQKSDLTDRDDQDNQSKLDNQINSNCDQNTLHLNNCLINKTESNLINDRKESNITQAVQKKSTKNEKTNLRQNEQQFNQHNKPTMSKDNELTMINKPLNKDQSSLFLPHSRPESDTDELFELNRTTAGENRNRLAFKQNQQQANSLYQPFTPTIINWSKINQESLNKPTKCKAKEIPNSRFKLRYNGRSIQYYCNENFIPEGKSRLYCDIFQGRWSSELHFRCKRKLN